MMKLAAKLLTGLAITTLIVSHSSAQLINTGNGMGAATWEYSKDKISWSPAIELSSATWTVVPGDTWASDSYSPLSRWISFTSDFNQMGSTSILWLRASFNAAQALPLEGRLLVDDVMIEMNLNSVNQRLSAGYNWGGSWFSFQTPSSTVVGANILTLGVYNTGGPVGLRVEGNTVPEPSTYALLLLSGAASLWALRRRKS